MASAGTWGFYGRQRELNKLSDVFGRGRWFFLRLTGRRRIGKTTLVQRALAANREVFYVQIPDSQPSGVIGAVTEAMETFRLNEERYPRPTSLIELARLVSKMARDGMVVVLDEFQYFSRTRLLEFTSALQAEVDQLSANSEEVPGGLVVLGSLHTEIAALLEDRNAPLYNRTTDEIALGHLNAAAVAEIVRSHANYSAEHLLFLWSLFEGVPKFYRDCFEQGVIGADRKTLLQQIFFESSSPLRYEAENWFLKEFRGQYDVVLKYVARNPGANHADIKAAVTSDRENEKQVGGYIKTLTDKFQMIEKRLPVFAKPKARKNRYYIFDNFLSSWLAALASPVAAMNFRPVDQLVEDADERLKVCEGYSLEKLAAQLYEERSRTGVGDFQLTDRIQGYWNSPDTEIDLVALDADHKRIRFGSCKRSSADLVVGAKQLDGHVDRFLKAFPKYTTWNIDRVAIAPSVPDDVRTSVESLGHIVQSIDELLDGVVA
ncbi:MAG: DUF234 domain-containing protein [Myxococcota bacterium]